MSIWENSGDWPKNARLAIEEIADQRNALRDEVAELKRKLAEVEGERDALRGCGVKLYVLYDLNSILYRALENISNQGHAFDGSTNADLAKRALKLYEDRAKQEKAQ